MRRSFHASIVLGALAAACNDPTNDLDPDGKYRPAPLAVPTASATYPDGPYGVAKGSVIPNYQFPGFPDAKADNSKLQTIALEDFYNPHADDDAYAPASADVDDRLFPPGSPYGAGNKKPTGLLIDLGSGWCAPCNAEAKDLLPQLHAKYAPCGGEFLYQLVEGANVGTDATEANLRTWTKIYKVDYPATIDPSRQLANGLYPNGMFPDGAVVDTRTMKVVDLVQGIPTDSFLASYEGLLDQACLQKP